MKLFGRFDKIIWDAQKQIGDLVYTSKGGLKKGITRKQYKYAIRARSLLKNIMRTRASGYYELFTVEVSKILELSEKKEARKK